MSPENTPSESTIPIVLETAHNLAQFQYKVVELLTTRPEDLAERVEDDVTLLEIVSDDYYEQQLQILEEDYKYDRESFSGIGKSLMGLAEKVKIAHIDKRAISEQYAKRLALTYELTERYKHSLEDGEDNGNGEAA